MDATALIVIMLIILELGGFFGRRRFGNRGLGGVLGLILIIILILWLLGRL